jgi:hypothetical protein
MLSGTWSLSGWRWREAQWGKHSIRDDDAERCRTRQRAERVCRVCKSESALARFLVLFIAAHRNSTREESSTIAGRSCWRPCPRRHASAMSTWCAFIARANPLCPRFTAVPNTLQPKPLHECRRCRDRASSHAPCSPTWQQFSNPM